MSKRILALVLALCMALSLFCLPANAQELTDAPVETVEQAAAQTIVGFAPFDVNAHALAASGIDRPSEKELTARMPGELGVVLAGGKTVSIPVEWKCTENYADSEDYFFLFLPQWDEEDYVLADGVDAEETPYVGVHLFAEERSSISTLAYSKTYAKNEEQAFAFLITEMGLNAAQACGVMANIYNECAFKPNNLQNAFEKSLGYTDDEYTAAVNSGKYRFQEKVSGKTVKYTTARDSFAHDHAGYGLCQWTYYTRKYDMYDYIKTELKADIGDMTAQLKFFKKEVTEGYSKLYANLKQYPNTASGAYKAAHYWVEKYEGCYEYYNGVNEWDKRAVLARDTYWPMYKDCAVQVTAPTVEEEPLSSTEEETASVIEVEEVAAALTKTAYAYTGSAIKPGVTVHVTMSDGTEADLVKGTDFTVSYKNNTSVGTATATVTGKDSYADCVVKLTFKINPKNTTVSSASSKSEGKITVKWKKNSSAGGYQVQVATNKSFTKNLKKKTVSGKSSVSHTFSGLKKKTKYYVRIRAYKSVGGTKYYSSWKTFGSTVKTK